MLYFSTSTFNKIKLVQAGKKKLKQHCWLSLKKHQVQKKTEENIINCLDRHTH